MIEQRNTIIHGDAVEVLKTLPDGIVQTCITSPPYYGLRDYGTGQWTGGSAECDHISRVMRPSDRSTLERHGTDGRSPQLDALPGIPYSQQCNKCGATRIDQQIGLEDTPEAYIARLVEVFREVKRVLRDDGTLWINCGDTYSSQLAGNKTPSGFSQTRPSRISGNGDQETVKLPKRNTGLKPKDLIGIPWMLAFALRADGWWLRSDIIWAKSNCMPESVTDRPTKAHEYIFLLSKSERYFYDADAIREPLRPKTFTTFGIKHHAQGNDALGKVKSDNWGRTVEERQPRLSADGTIAGANKRSVWTVSTYSYPGSHFATFPPKLIEPCILAGSRVGDVVLDCFCGAGTVPLVSIQHHRQYIGIELNPEYVKLINDRIAVVQPDLWDTGVLSVVRERLAEASPEEADELLDKLDALIEEKGGVA